MKNSVLPYVLSGVGGGTVVLAAQLLLTSPQAPVQQTTNDLSKSPVQTQLTNNTGEQKIPTSFNEAAEKVMPAVVHITSIKEYRPRSAEEQRFYDFFGAPQPSKGTGSGVIISPKGYIVTNNHVINGASTVEVVLHDKRKFQARVIGTDPSTDLAVLQIEAANLPVVAMTNSDEAKIGEWVLAVGNPFELTSTVTAGIISAKGRNINILGGRQSIESFIQTDAAVNPGNSGGALVNVKGELLGINTAIATPTGTFAGYSFAVPINLVKKVVQDLIDFGEVRRGFLGVMIQEVDDALAKKLNLTVPQGVYVQDLMPEGGAAEAGVKKGDVIVAVNGNSIKNVAELQEKIGSRNPGEAVSLTVVRDGSSKELMVKLKN
jgi:Do/DeqQ family serine protease